MTSPDDFTPTCTSKIARWAKAIKYATWSIRANSSIVARVGSTFIEFRHQLNLEVELAITVHVGDGTSLESHIWKCLNR